MNYKHLNDNMLCAIDVETSGLLPGYHEILQIAAIPLGSDFSWNSHARFFDHDMCPDFPDRVDPEAVKTLRKHDTSLDYDGVVVSKERIAKFVNSGIEKYKCADMFLDWFESLRLKPKKRLIAVGHNLPFDMAFISDWLGPATFELIFDPRWRDTMGISLFWNDVDAFRQNRCTFKDAKLGSLCTSLKVENMMAHNAFDDAMATAKCYQRMVHQFDLFAKVPEAAELPEVDSKESKSHERAIDKWVKALPQEYKDAVIAEYEANNGTKTAP